MQSVCLVFLLAMTGCSGAPSCVEQPARETGIATKHEHIDPIAGSFDSPSRDQATDRVENPQTCDPTPPVSRAQVAEVDVEPEIEAHSGYRPLN